MLTGKNPGAHRASGFTMSHRAVNMTMRRITKVAVTVMIIGQSGSGKSTSLRNFGADDAFVINVSGKPMPFKNNGLKIWKSSDYAKITKVLKDAPTPSIVIDDATYLMTDEFIRMAGVKGYDKFTDMAKNFYDLV